MKQDILNLTQHTPTPEQLAAGVFDHPDEAVRTLVRALLTFDELPAQAGIVDAAEGLADIAARLDVEAALVGGAPWLMAELEAALVERGVLPMYAFSRRESVEAVEEDGTTTKRSVFRHVGFVVAGRFAARVHDAAHRRGGKRQGRLDRVRAAFPGARR